jgi:4-hydroxy-tetrahydrodipicolinate reductase
VTTVVRVGVLGASGRMGREVCGAVAAAPDLALVAAVDPAFGDVGGAAPVGGDPSRGDALVGADREVLERAGAEVVVDFTTAEAARANLPWCAARGMHAVVGTTGLLEEDLGVLRQLFGGGPANAVVASNFAIGAVLLIRFCELAAPHMDGVEIIELHHDRKRDAPSGTALRTAARVAAARAASGAPGFAPDPTTEETLAGARGGRGPGGVHLHSVRLPGLVAHEEVIFGAPGQALTLRHDSFDRRSFMPGVLLAVREVPGRPGLTEGLDALLGL